ncbi:MAG: histidinol dehydrogenase [Flavobacteriales bacterium]|nr:histidinol dehydrogenase [Flavobacteriales bacterium]
MKTVKFPDQKDWLELIKRPDFETESIEETVREILSTVKRSGDEAVLKYAKKFDRLSEDSFVFETDGEPANLSAELKEAIDIAIKNIEKFHISQKEVTQVVETLTGVKCWRKSLPIQTVGLYVPGGTAPLLSSLMMLAIPAKLAGCENIVVCTPPDENGNVNPAITFIAKRLEIGKIVKIGGAQAIAAMAYGTKSVRKCDKIFGPGNRFVTKAKQLVQEEGTAIDMPAGPSEVLVIADAKADPRFVAADLLSQAEHGTDSQVVLVITDQNGPTEKLVADIKSEIESQLNALPRKEIAQKALENSLVAIFGNDREAMDFSNSYAPEHLIINTENASALAEEVKTAGSVFIGKWSCESIGDYASGTNHTLPTNGFARSYSGVSLDSFVKKVTFQEISQEGIENIGRAVELLAEAEGLQAHKNAVTLRLS